MITKKSGKIGSALPTVTLSSPEVLPRRLVVSFLFVALLLIGGVVGFMVLERETFLDALLTTISAVSTVGYSPPRPLGVPGKILAIVLILGGLFGIALVISVLTEYFMEGHLYGALGRRSMDRAISELKDHFIISGFGRVGREVARTLSAAGVPFVVLDVNQAVLVTAKSSGYLFIEEDPTSDEVLLQAGIMRAKGLVACADSDANNVYVTLTARSINPDVFIVARAAFGDAEAKLYRAGANRVVSPYVMAGRHMAQMAAEPMLADYVDFLFDGRHFGVMIRELRVSEMRDIAGHSVGELHKTKLGGAFVLAIDRGDQRIEDVGPDTVVCVDDRLLLVGSGEWLRKLSTIE